MRVAITGAGGFFGRHLRVRLYAAGLHEIVAIDRAAFLHPTSLAKAVADVDAVVHLAGVNRGEAHVVESQNALLATQLVSALDTTSSTAFLVFANTIHAGADTPYGRGKQRACEILETWAARRGSALVNVVFHNLFGEGGRPNYNSFVATFCDLLSVGGQPEIETDRPLELIHAQEAALTIQDVLASDAPPKSATLLTHGVVTTVSEVRARLTAIADCYTDGTFPDLGDRFTRQLFNTYRSFLFPERYPLPLLPKEDHRGMFVEAVRSGGGKSQVSYSTTAAGVTRGNHFHLEKVERFLVLKGRARIAIRPVFGTDVHGFDVSGDQPSVIDIPTLHTHNITNVGSGDLYTLFWTDEIYDPTNADTFMEPVA
ncbi:MAG: UDP-2-acetamido-2,6-beta-L-arabino-hexul-4-ose reductase [Acidimicrobiaceae bacterium]|nr:UDP-2-acetamido-2,6-beta-L-arabino-hexul-4-ose reductase [Acidimicrobiaceae bacterium]